MKQILALAICLSCIATAQERAHAQWEDPKSNGYSSSAAQLSALDKALSILEKSNPMRDLQMSLSKKDFRFVAYNGYGAVVPGLTKKQLFYYMNKRFGFKVLTGSTDVLTEELANRIEKISKNYMEPYNKGILRYLQAKEGKQSKNKR